MSVALRLTVYSTCRRSNGFNEVEPEGRLGREGRRRRPVAFAVAPRAASRRLSENSDIFLQQGDDPRRARGACLCTAKGLAQLRHDVYENAGGEFAGDTSSSVNITLVELRRRSPRSRRSRADSTCVSTSMASISRVFNSATETEGTSY
jgi:hypothetical protein